MSPVFPGTNYLWLTTQSVVSNTMEAPKEFPVGMLGKCQRYSFNFRSRDSCDYRAHSCLVHSAIVGDVLTDIPQQTTPVEDDAKNRKQLLFILCVLNSVLLSDASFKTAIRSETLTLDPQSKCVAHLFLSIYYDILPLISQTLKLIY